MYITPYFTSICTFPPTWTFQNATQSFFKTIHVQQNALIKLTKPRLVAFFFKSPLEHFQKPPQLLWELNKMSPYHLCSYVGIYTDSIIYFHVDMIPYGMPITISPNWHNYRQYK